jgi:lipopolysaccharide/colanic/teichoic acid biosynthesis glycosyltransferase
LDVETENRMIQPRESLSITAGGEAELNAAPLLAAPAEGAERTVRTFYYQCKRVLDMAGALLLLLALTPLLALIAALIKLDSRGPVFYVQYRVGSRRQRRGAGVAWQARLFPFYKFRTMYTNSDESLHREYVREFCEGRISTEPSNGSSGSSETRFKLKNDPRVTRVGGFLRRTSLDELPQLINVLRGEMSLVGPRPVPPYEVAHYKEEYFERLAAPPGMTGLWQVYGRGRVPFEEMMRMDIEYARTASLWLDAKLLALTLPAVLQRHGAE